MEEMILEKDALSIAKENFENFLATHDVKYVAEDVHYRNLATGDEYVGREAVGGMLHYLYHVAFDAEAEITNKIVTEKKAMFEANFKGRHIGEFAGIPATNKEVNVPVCVSYDLEDGLIKKARIYFLTDVLMKQLS
ncbi:MAG TPA: ester cyclase [Chitinophagaceae bacterium]|nr:ester cyclase [Chitinophagaceae bacterium]